MGFVRKEVHIRYVLAKSKVASSELPRGQIRPATEATMFVFSKVTVVVLAPQRHAMPLARVTYF